MIPVVESQIVRMRKDGVSVLSLVDERECRGRVKGSALHYKRVSGEKRNSSITELCYGKERFSWWKVRSLKW
jgi:hypothetical protein